MAYELKLTPATLSDTMIENIVILTGGRTIYSRYKRFTFQEKLLGLFLAVTFLFAVIYAAYYGLSKNLLRKNMTAYSEIYVDSITSSITNMVEELDRLSKTFLLENEMIYNLGQDIAEDSSDYADYYNEVRASIERMLNIRNDIEGILIADSSGRVITGGPNVPYREGTNIAGESWYQEFMESDKMFQIMPIRKTNAVEVFSIVRKLRSYEFMRVNGIVRIDMKKKLLDEICQKRRLQYNTIVLLDKNKELYYVSGKTPVENALAEMKSRLSAGRSSGTHNFQVLSGSENLNISYQYSDYLELYILYIVPQNVLMSGLNDLNKNAVILLLFGGVAGISLAIGASRLMSRGVARVMAGMQAVESGNLDVVVSVDSNDEIRTIANGFNHMLKRIKVLMEEKAQIEIKKKEAEMMMLQRQIRPHFLYNTLDGIRMKALLSKNQDTAEMIEKLSVLLRRTTDLKTEYVTLHEELKYIIDYIDLQNLRFRYKFRLIIDISEDLKAMIIPKFSLQPLIENAVHHGLEKRTRGRCIWVEAELQEQMVVLKVSDNGMGIEPDRLEEIRSTLNNPDMLESEHIGLNNINIRLKLYYGPEYGLTISSEVEKGTVLKLYVPRIQHESGGTDV